MQLLGGSSAEGISLGWRGGLAMVSVSPSKKRGENFVCFLVGVLKKGIVARLCSRFAGLARLGPVSGMLYYNNLPP